MDPKLRTEIDNIFLEGLELAPGQRRAEFLDQRCVHLPVEVRDEVEKMLKADAETDRINISNLVKIVETTPASSIEETGTTIGPYRLLQRLGEGGMGVVYMAEQRQPIRRRVAVKLLKPGMDSRQVVARFEAERQALAMMEHPNIAQVLDVGTTDSGRPYFVMELVKGVPITTYCDDKQMTIAERLKLFVSVCHAVQHAHQKGIVHRDLKPSNILVAEYDNETVPKVIDFGLAKALHQSLTDKTMFTQFGQILGTFEYMSPEQAKLNQLDIDTRTDIYSLGVLLYELLTGYTPFESKTLRDAAFDEMLRVIREVDPPRPSTKLTSSITASTVAAKRAIDLTRLNTLVRGDLDAIVMKSLDKERNRRYETCVSLAEDVKRFLNDEPVTATTPSTIYYLSRFTRRNRTTVATVGAVFLTLLTAISLTTIAWRQSKHLLAVNESQLTQLKTKTEEIRDTSYRYGMHLAFHEWAQRHTLKVHELLEEQVPEDSTETDLRGFEWYLLASICKANRGDETYAKELDNGWWQLSADGSTLATLTDGSIVTTDLANGKATRLVELPAGATAISAISNDAIRVVTQIDHSRLRVDTPSGESYELDQIATTDWTTVVFSPDGNWVAEGAPHGIQVWNAEDGGNKFLLPTYADPEEAGLKFIDFTQDSKQLVAAFKRKDEDVIIWDLETREKRTFASGRGIDCASIFDEHRVIIGGPKGLSSVSLTNGDLQDEPFWLPDTKLIDTMDISADRKRLALRSSLNVAEVWDLESKSKVWSQVRKQRENAGIQFANDGHDVLLESKDGVDICHIDRGTLATGPSVGLRFNAHDCMAVHGSDVVLSGGNNDIVIWDADTADHRNFKLPTTAEASPGVITGVAISPTGSTIAIASAFSTKKHRHVVQVFDSNTHDLLHSYTDPQSARVFRVAYSLDGTRLACGGNALTIWDTAKGEIVSRVHAPSATSTMCFSPDGQRLYTGHSWNGSLAIWNIRDDQLELEREFKSDVDYVWTVARSSDDKWLIAGHTSGNIIVYDLTDLSVRAELNGHSMSVRSLAFSPDDEAVISGGDDGVVKVWQVETWKEVAELQYGDPIQAVRFITVADRSHGLVVGTHAEHGAQAALQVHWIEDNPAADWSWLRN